MRLWRHNADLNLRELERRASAGDPQAFEDLVRHRLRTGTLTVDWLAAAGPAAVRLLPYELRQNLWEVMKVAAYTSPPNADRSRGGWFPGHNRMDVCPRGHSIQDMGFEFTEITSVSRPATQAEPELLRLSGREPDTGDDEYPILTCSQCWASWPVAGEVEFE